MPISEAKLEQIAKEGGPAFPFKSPPEGNWAWHGMTLREWFAGQALVGILAGRYSVTTDPKYAADHIAEDAYKVADAMLKAGGDHREHEAQDD